MFFAGRIKELSRPIFQAKALIGLPFLRKMLTGEIAKSDLIPPPPTHTDLSDTEGFTIMYFVTKGVVATNIKYTVSRQSIYRDIT